MCGGRVELGLGAGWFEAEHAAYGIPFPGRRAVRPARRAARDRSPACGARPSASVRLRRRALHAQPTRPRCPSRCSRRGSPVIVGGTGRAHARAGGPVRRRVQPGVPRPTDDGTAVASVREACTEAGRDPVDAHALRRAGPVRRARRRRGRRARRRHRARRRPAAGRTGSPGPRRRSSTGSGSPRSSASRASIAGAGPARPGPPGAPCVRGRGAPRLTADTCRYLSPTWGRLAPSPPRPAPTLDRPPGPGPPHSSSVAQGTCDPAHGRSRFTYPQLFVTLMCRVLADSSIRSVRRLQTPVTS